MPRTLKARFSIEWFRLHDACGSVRARAYENQRGNRGIIPLPKAMAIQGLVHAKPYGKFVAFDIAIDPGLGKRKNMFLCIDNEAQ
jgi:hypothetical protein